MFIATLFTIAQIWKQLQCPSVQDWMKKMVYSKCSSPQLAAAVWLGSLSGRLKLEELQTQNVLPHRWGRMEQSKEILNSNRDWTLVFPRSMLLNDVGGSRTLWAGVRTWWREADAGGGECWKPCHYQHCKLGASNPVIKEIKLNVLTFKEVRSIRASA